MRSRRPCDFLAAYLAEIKQRCGACHGGRGLLPFPRAFVPAVRKVDETMRAK